MSENALTVVTSPAFLAPAGTVEDFKRAYQLKKDIISGILTEGTDFGKVPGSDKPALLKSGAEKMNNLYALHPEFIDIETVEDWTGEQHSGEQFFYYRQKCCLYRDINGQRVMVDSADGSCNSWEKKYRYRQAQRLCPNCNQPAIFQSKNKPEFYCWNKKGGCGATFPLTDKRIIEQEVGQIKNPDVAEQVNTILKMAQKRALVAATLIATNTSDYFTQDIEDFVKPGDFIDAHVEDVKGNPDPIDQKARAAWQALAERAAVVNVHVPEINEETMTKSELRLAYKELEGFVLDAEEQAMQE